MCFQTFKIIVFTKREFGSLTVVPKHNESEQRRVRWPHFANLRRWHNQLLRSTPSCLSGFANFRLPGTTKEEGWWREMAVMQSHLMSPWKRLEIEPLARTGERIVTFVITECQNLADPINSSSRQHPLHFTDKEMEAGDHELLKGCLCVSSAKDQVLLLAIATQFSLAPLTVYCRSGEVPATQPGPSPYSIAKTQWLRQGWAGDPSQPRRFSYETPAGLWERGVLAPPEWWEKWVGSWPWEARNILWSKSFSETEWYVVGAGNKWDPILGPSSKPCIAWNLSGMWAKQDPVLIKPIGFLFLLMSLNFPVQMMRLIIFLSDDISSLVIGMPQRQRMGTREDHTSQTPLWPSSSHSSFN